MSAQVDRFVHDRLPPAAQLPVFRYDLPELQLPDQLNLVEELLDKAAAKGFGDKPMLRLRISAIVDACFRLIADAVSAPSWTRRGCTQARGSMYLNRPRSV